MCITSGEASLSKTKILSMPIGNGKHLLSYSNNVENLSGKTNSMILPIPGKVDKGDFYDTTDYNKFIDDIEESTKYSKLLSRSSKSYSNSIQEFKNGLYTVIIANTFNIQDVKDRLGELDENSRPEISSDLLDFFADHYSGWDLVICIFDGDKKMESQPIMFEYTPVSYDWIFFPTMDSHSGGAPDLNDIVILDHSLITEAPNLYDKWVKKFGFSQKVPEVLNNRKFVTNTFKNKMINGDFFVNIENLNKVTDNPYDVERKFSRIQVHPCKLEV